MLEIIIVVVFMVLLRIEVLDNWGLRFVVHGAARDNFLSSCLRIRQNKSVKLSQKFLSMS